MGTWILETHKKFSIDLDDGVKENYARLHKFLTKNQHSPIDNGS